MPTRRTSPRRTITRPGTPYERAPEPLDDFDDFDDRPGFLASVAPWLAIVALVLAAGTALYLILGRSSANPDLTACRSAAWSAIPDSKNLPASWALGSTDLNANGMTISVVGPAPADGTTSPPTVYASVTCYGDSAVTALSDNRKAAQAAGSTVTDRTADGQAYDVDNPTTGSVTTLFRVGDLVGQVADAGTSTPADLAKITDALATAMGDRAAAGAPGAAASDGATGSSTPGSSDSGAGASPSGSPFAPELEALLPRQIGGVAAPSGASAAPAVALTIQSASATDVFGQDPASRALAARIRSLGGTLDQLQIAQAFDETGGIDLSIIAFRLPNADGAKLRAAILETWLSASAPGVKTTEVDLAGKKLTKVDYGDGSTIEYVYGKADYVIVIDTSDARVATEVAAKLP